MIAVTELSAADAEEVLELYRDHPGWEDRSYSDVRRALKNTDIAVGLRDGDHLVSSARVMTDFVYYAKVYDVIVAADRRGEGLGHRLMEEVANHEKLSGMANQHLELICREGLVSFYRDCGFEQFDATAEIDGQEEPYVKMNYKQ